MQRLSLHRRARRGTTAIEYALIATLVAGVIVVALTQLGDVVEVFYTIVDGLVSGAI